ALEIRSRRKISRWRYNEWLMSLSSSRTSAWKPSVSLEGVPSEAECMAPGVCGRRILSSSRVEAARSARADGRPESHGPVGDEMAARAHQVVELVPEKKESFHREAPAQTSVGAIVGTRLPGRCVRGHSRSRVWLLGMDGVASLWSASR